MEYSTSQGFGTGTHETTFLCLSILDEFISSFEKEACLDFGCGSGILGLAAHVLEFKNIDFFDIETEALENTDHNIKINFNKSTLLKTFSKKNKIKKMYNLVFANILANILEQEKEFIVSRIINGGHLILSGLLLNQSEEITKFYTSDDQVELIQKKTKGDWVALLFKKRD